MPGPATGEDNSNPQHEGNGTGRAGSGRRYGIGVPMVDHSECAKVKDRHVETCDDEKEEFNLKSRVLDIGGGAGHKHTEAGQRCDDEGAPRPWNELTGDATRTVL